MKRSPLPARRSRPRKRKTTVRLAGEAMRQLRLRALVRAHWKCEGIRDGERCNEPLTEHNSELCHVVSRGRQGSDTIENVWVSCKWRSDGEANCHQRSHNCGGKPVPPAPAL